MMNTAVSLHCCFFLVLLAGCHIPRDDTTSQMREIISEQLGRSYDDVGPNATLGKLGCDDLDVVELIMELEEHFNIAISDDDFDSLGGSEGWQSISVLDLSNLVRQKTQP